MKPGEPLRPSLLVVRQRDEEDDEPQFRPLEWGLILRLFRYTAPERRKVILLTGLTLLRGIQLPALTWAMSRIISGPIAHHQAGILPWAVLGYGVLALFTDGMFHYRQRYALELGELVVNGLRREIFLAIQRQPMAFFHRTKIGRIIGRVTSDVESVRAGIQDVLFVSTVQGGQMVFAAALMLWSDWLLFLFVVALAPILWTVNRHFRVKLSREARAASESFSRVTATLAESVNGMRVSQGFVRQETNVGFFRNLLADHSRHSVAQARTSGILVPLLELNSQFFIAALLLLGGWRVLHGQMSLTDLIQFFFLANLFFAPIATLGNQYNTAVVAMAGAERVFRLVDREPEWKDAPEATALHDPRREAFPESGALGARVEFHAVSFGYDPSRLVLHDIAFTAEPGQTIALVGHTGSGKSSIINLVSKFYLAGAGEVLIDGRDIRGITSLSLHRQLGMVQQQNFLFSGTVLENIRYARPEASDAEVRAAAESLGVLDLLEHLPAGFGTLVGEHGAGLSVGQQQLVCFTRAMLADPRLVLLDEATSAIDALTEARLQQALMILLRGRTSLVVAHRLTTIRRADQILVLDGGRIVERGTHEALLLRGGRYAELHEQFAATHGDS
jgi:ATP-binding cassette subfamily B protein